MRLPEDISTAEGVSQALATILAAAAQGEITIGEAVQLAGLVELPSVSGTCPVFTDAVPGAVERHRGNG
jgi:hypothetical protein